MTWSRCHCGSDWLAGSQAISSLNTTSPSITAATLRSLAPRSKPIRQPSRWRAQGDGGLALGREVGPRSGDDLERDAEQLGAHEGGVEDPRWLRRVVPGQERDEGRRPVDAEPGSTAGPQEELAQALHRAVRGDHVGMARRDHPRLPVPGGAGRLLDGQRDADPRVIGPDGVAEAGMGQRHRPEVGIERRHDPRCHGPGKEASVMPWPPRRTSPRRA